MLPAPAFEPSLILVDEPDNNIHQSRGLILLCGGLTSWGWKTFGEKRKNLLPPDVTQPVFCLFLLVFLSQIKQGFLSRDAGWRDWSALAAGASAWVKPTGPEWITGVHWIWRLCWIILGIRWLSWVYWSQEESSLVKNCQEKAQCFHMNYIGSTISLTHSLIIFHACMTFYLLWKHKENISKITSVLLAIEWKSMRSSVVLTPYPPKISSFEISCFVLRGQHENNFIFR